MEDTQPITKLLERANPAQRVIFFCAVWVRASGLVWPLRWITGLAPIFSLFALHREPHLAGAVFFFAVIVVSLLHKTIL